VINQLITEKKFYDAALHIVSRMKQATVNDGVSSFEKMCQFQYESKPYVLLNDQEAEFFKDEICWLTDNNLERESPDIKNFVKDTENDLYYVDIHFRGNNYRLAISNESYERIVSR
jgi:hypothetical protein